jgi:hypothetical protein
MENAHNPSVSTHSDGVGFLRRCSIWALTNYSPDERPPAKRSTRPGPEESNVSEFFDRRAFTIALGNSCSERAEQLARRTVESALLQVLESQHPARQVHDRAGLQNHPGERGPVEEWRSVLVRVSREAATDRAMARTAGSDRSAPRAGANSVTTEVYAVSERPANSPRGTAKSSPTHLSLDQRPKHGNRLEHESRAACRKSGTSQS